MANLTFSKGLADILVLLGVMINRHCKVKQFWLMDNLQPFCCHNKNILLSMIFARCCEFKYDIVFISFIRDIAYPSLWALCLCGSKITTIFKKCMIGPIITKLCMRHQESDVYMSEWGYSCQSQRWKNWLLMGGEWWNSVRLSVMCRLLQVLYIVPYKITKLGTIFIHLWLRKFPSNGRRSNICDIFSHPLRTCSALHRKRALNSHKRWWWFFEPHTNLCFSTQSLEVEGSSPQIMCEHKRTQIQHWNYCNYFERSSGYSWF